MKSLVTMYQAPAGWTTGLLPDLHFLLMRAGIVAARNEARAGLGDEQVGIGGAGRFGDAGRIGFRSDDVELVGADQGLAGGPAVLERLVDLGRRVHHRHVDLLLLQQLERGAGAGLDPNHLCVCAAGKFLGQQLEQAELARAAGGQRKAVRAGAVGGARFVGGDGGKGEAECGQRGEFQDGTTHGGLLYFAALGKKSCSPPIL
jgi:hypothetical protein